MAHHYNGKLLKNIFSVMDGARMKCMDYADVDTQNEFHEGQTCSVEVTYLLVYSLDGCIFYAGLRCPGSRHDSRIANELGLIGNLLMDKNTPTGMAVLFDSAFMVKTKQKRLGSACKKNH